MDPKDLLPNLPWEGLPIPKGLDKRDALSLLQAGLAQSMTEEAKAVNVYTVRASYARLHGFEDVAKVYDHIIGEERQHFIEFSEEKMKLSQIKFPPK